MSKEAIKLDCYTLMNAFLAENDLSFACFCDKWLEYEFYSVF